MTRLLLWITTAAAFLAATVLGGGLILWLSVGGTFFRGQPFGVGSAVGMVILAAACAGCVYGGVRALRASRRA